MKGLVAGMALHLHWPWCTEARLSTLRLQWPGSLTTLMPGGQLRPEPDQEQGPVHMMSVLTTLTPSPSPAGVSHEQPPLRHSPPGSQSRVRASPGARHTLVWGIMHGHSDVIIVIVRS